MKPVAVVSNYTHRGHWNKPDCGFRLSKSTDGRYIVPCIGGNGWRTAGQYIHHLIHKCSYTNRIWIEMEDGSQELVWWYEKEWINRELVRKHFGADAFYPHDVRW